MGKFTICTCINSNINYLFSVTNIILSSISALSAKDLLTSYDTKKNNKVKIQLAHNISIV